MTHTSYKNWDPPTKEKNSNFTVFEIANNFIARIKFLAHKLATKKLGTLKAPRNNPQTTLICTKDTNKNSNFAVF